jgi:hypothetical protein
VEQDRLGLFSFAVAEKRSEYLGVLRAFDTALANYVVLLHSGDVADLIARNPGRHDSLTTLDIAPLLEPLLAAGMDPWRAWAWLTQPAALTFGRAPEEAVTDPEMTDLVRHAAVRLAEHVARA